MIKHKNKLLHSFSLKLQLLYEALRGNNFNIFRQYTNYDKKRKLSPFYVLLIYKKHLMFYAW